MKIFPFGSYHIRVNFLNIGMCPNLLLLKYLVGDIWDSIAQDAGQEPLPEWQKKELNKRYAEYKAGEIETYDCQAVHDELREKYGFK